MDAIQPGERAAQLPWLWPDAQSLVALADAPTHYSWQQMRHDPGGVFFRLAHQATHTDEAPGHLPDAFVLNDAAHRLEAAHVPWRDWRHPAVLPVVRTARAAAIYAELLAEPTNTLERETTSAGAWIAYASWLAVGVAHPEAVLRCLSTPRFAYDAWGAQLECWGLSRADIAWRLSDLWPMPTWAKQILTRLDAAPETLDEQARRRHAIVQVAVALAEQTETRLRVADEFSLGAALAALHLSLNDLDGIRKAFAGHVDQGHILAMEWGDPRTIPGLPEQLRLAANSLAIRQRLPEEPTIVVDVVGERIQAAKLASLAEFAAGASHEINNPLAVISAQSQYLLRHEADPERVKSLRSIIRQTERIHTILTDLMGFARPANIKAEPLELNHLALSTAESLAGWADDHRVRLETQVLQQPLWLEADAKQLRTALAAILRNGIEAAGNNGWVRLRVAFLATRLELIVEDSGPGPSERTREHLFDPFFSGRHAGRGRGLGLSTAWRVAREHGGDVKFVPVQGGPTRFVLTLPAARVFSDAGRQSA